MSINQSFPPKRVLFQPCGSSDALRGQTLNRSQLVVHLMSRLRVLFEVIPVQRKLSAGTDRPCLAKDELPLRQAHDFPGCHQATFNHLHAL